MSMIFETQEELKERIEALTPRRCSGEVPVTSDTSNYMSIMGGTVLRLEGNDYFITGEAREGRFGIDDQPKYWVKYAVDLADGSRKVIKLVFHEQFQMKLGPFNFRCVREPDKESRVLELVARDDRFMQGRTVHDACGNNVRIVDFIEGTSLYATIAEMDMPHEAYFHEALPEILENLVGCIDALEHLRENGEQHGDVRNDHIIIEGIGRGRRARGRGGDRLGRDGHRARQPGPGGRSQGGHPQAPEALRGQAGVLLGGPVRSARPFSVRLRLRARERLRLRLRLRLRARARAGAREREPYSSAPMIGSVPFEGME